MGTSYCNGRALNEPLYHFNINVTGYFFIRRDFLSFDRVTASLFIHIA